MRTIKFRAWDIDEKRMWTHEEIDKSDKDGVIMWGDLLENAKKYGFELMQFTGLHDKNGKEIYEGDIVKTTFNFKDSSKTDIAIVEYDELNPCFVMTYKYKGIGHKCHEYDFISCGLRTNEVIGNIHQNTELLK